MYSVYDIGLTGVDSPPCAGGREGQCRRETQVYTSGEYRSRTKAHVPCHIRF